MMYCTTNFKTKKALKDAVAAGKRVTVYSPEPQESAPTNGTAAVGGPHFPAPHAWYAQVTLDGGIVVKVK